MAQSALMATRDSKDRRRQGLGRGQDGEEEAVLTQFLCFFHGNYSVDWTLPQAEPQEGEKVEMRT